MVSSSARRQDEVPGARQLVDVVDARRLRDHERRRAPGEERERDGSRRDVVRGRDPGEDVTTPAAAARELPRAERAVADERHAVPLADRQDHVLGVALGQVVEHLIAGDDALAGDLDGVLDVGDVEVRETPREDLSLFLQLFERAHRLFEWLRATPVQQVEIESIGTEAAQALLAREERPGVGRVIGMDLRSEEHVAAISGDRLADELLDVAARIDLRGVDVDEPAIDRATDRDDRRLAIIRFHLPRAEPHDGHAAFERPEPPEIHVGEGISALGVVPRSCRARGHEREHRSERRGGAAGRRESAASVAGRVGRGFGGLRAHHRRRVHGGRLGRGRSGVGRGGIGRIEPEQRLVRVDDREVRRHVDRADSGDVLMDVEVQVHRRRRRRRTGSRPCPSGRRASLAGLPSRARLACGGSRSACRPAAVR